MPPKTSKSVVLVGMMGCGKSAIGTRLSEKLGVPFIDTDKHIEERTGLSVSDIFSSAGEAYFRVLERETLEACLNGPRCVLATGGGTFMNAENRKYIKQHGVSVWLKAGFDILLERVSRKNTRPLLEKGDKATLLRELMEKREPIYKKADMTVETTTGPHEIVVERILEALKK